MDKVTASDELKEKILLAAHQKLSENKNTIKKSKVHYFVRYAAAAAASFAIVLTSFAVVKNHIVPNNDIIHVATNSDKDVKPPKKDDTNPISSNTPKTNDNQNDASKGGAKSYGDNESPDNKNPFGNKGGFSKGNTSLGENTTGKNDEINSNETGSNETDTGEITPDVTLPGTPQIPDGDFAMGTNPFEDLSLDEIKEKVGYDFKIPHFMCDGYSSPESSLLFGELIQISYKNESEDTILYRTQKTDEDVSEIYNSYEKTETENMDGKTVTFKSNGEKCYLASWNDEESSYSIYSTAGIKKDDMKKIAESVK